MNKTVLEPERLLYFTKRLFRSMSALYFFITPLPDPTGFREIFNIKLKYNVRMVLRGIHPNVLCMYIGSSINIETGALKSLFVKINIRHFYPFIYAPQ